MNEPMTDPDALHARVKQWTCQTRVPKSSARELLIDSRNRLMKAIVKLRGGHSAVMDDCDEAMAELDIAIGRSGQAESLIRDLAAEHTRLREELAEYQQSFVLCESHTPDKWEGNDACIICEAVDVWAQRETAVAQVAALQAQLHAAEATIATVEKQLGVCDRMLQDEIEDNRVRQREGAHE